MSLSPEASQKPAPAVAPTSQEIDQLKSNVHHILTAAQARAEKSGKPLLILVGEQHPSPNSALMDSIIYQQARELGVKDVALELPSTIPQIQRNMNEMTFVRGHMYGHSLVYQQAQFFSADVHMVDGRYMMAIEGAVKGITGTKTGGPTSTPALTPAITPKPQVVSAGAPPQLGAGEKIPQASPGKQASLLDALHIRERNETISANLTRIPRPTIMITGAAHVPGLLDKMQRYGTHEVVSFDVSNFSQERGVESPWKPAPAEHVLTLKGDARLLTVDQIIGYGMGAQAPAFSRWAEQKGTKMPQEKSAAFQQRAQATLKANPQDLDALAGLAIAQYQLGQDREAGITEANFMTTCRKTQADTHKSAMCTSVLLSYDSSTSPAFNNAFADNMPHIALERARAVAVPAQSPKGGPVAAQPAHTSTGLTPATAPHAIAVHCEQDRLFGLVPLPTKTCKPVAPPSRH